MKEMDVLFKTVSEGLRILAQGVKVIADKLDAFTEENAGRAQRAPGRGTAPREAVGRTRTSKPRRVPPEKPSRRGRKPGPTAQKVYEAVRRTEGPVNIDLIVKNTGCDKKQVHNALYKLKKQGKVENLGKAVYRAVP